jgi:hypothetical protein
MRQCFPCRRISGADLIARRLGLQKYLCEVVGATAPWQGGVLNLSIDLIKLLAGLIALGGVWMINHLDNSLLSFPTAQAPAPNDAR